MLRRSAAVIEGTVRKIVYTYDEQQGPRTVSTVSIDEVYLGSAIGSTVELQMFGGPSPDGMYMSSSLGSEFVVGGRYILFLTNSHWSDTPLEARPLRISVVSGREVLSEESGHPLTGFEPEGMRFGSNKVTTTPTDGVSTLASAVAGTLGRLQFKRLLREAIADERVAPSGTFRRTPMMLADNWRDSPAAPAPDMPQPTIGGTAKVTK